MARKPKSEALQLIDRLIAITPKTNDVVRAYLVAARDRMRFPMSAVLEKVPGETVLEKCAKIGITRQNYYGWLRDAYRPNAAQAKKLAQITGLDFDDIRGRVPPARSFL